METVTIPKSKYKELKEKAELNESLLLKLVMGLEDIREGRIKPWRKRTIS